MALLDCYDAYLAALLRADRVACAAIVRDALAAGVSVRTLYTELFHASLYEIGERWQANQVSVATEHLATAVTEYVLNRVVAPALLSREPVGRTIIVSCASNEFHQIGGRMVADVCEMQGWDSHFLGANTSQHKLLHMLERKLPDVLAFSIAVYANLPTLRRSIEAVRLRYPTLPIWVGGQMFTWGGQELAEQYPHVTVFGSLDHLVAELEGFGAPHP